MSPDLFVVHGLIVIPHKNRQVQSTLKVLRIYAVFYVHWWDRLSEALMHCLYLLVASV